MISDKQRKVWRQRIEAAIATHIDLSLHQPSKAELRAQLHQAVLNTMPQLPPLPLLRGRRKVCGRT